MSGGSIAALVGLAGLLLIILSNLICHWLDD